MRKQSVKGITDAFFTHAHTQFGGTRLQKSMENDAFNSGR